MDHIVSWTKLVPLLIAWTFLQLPKYTLFFIAPYSNFTKVHYPYPLHFRPRPSTTTLWWNLFPSLITNWTLLPILQHPWSSSNGQAYHLKTPAGNLGTHFKLLITLRTR
jgi:hypothetical protein